ncbi:hypothetical protein ABB27_17800 [Stenotrophomonas terrae]|uniref:Peptidase inhibitor I78 family protein n=1 Tax=Stenotrophomonas terrae TaxID=405446 RepID=A0A0R0CAD6_9GAMM|nr:hypothetical protein [Stenotrophomonas terrae]KRG63143.1 hypothetical protein ABB27_17800 [Stenotrophomonas terrae]
MPAITLHHTAAALRPLLVGGLLATALSACVSAPPVANTDPNFGLCSDASLQWAVGTVNDEATVRRLKKESGAGLLNPISPTTIVSRDIRKDRLRVFVDANNVITAVRCE